MFLRSTQFAQALVCWALILFVQDPFATAQGSKPGGRGTIIRSWPASPFMSAEQESKIIDALKAPNTVLQAGEQTLEKIADLMNQVVPTHVDRMRIFDVGHSVDDRFTITAEDVNHSLASILVRLFDENSLTFIVRNAMVEITTNEVAESQTGKSVRVYDITPLVDRLQDADIDRNEDYPRSGPYALISCIQTTVYPDTWADTVGGPSSIEPYQMGNQSLLVISAPTLVHMSAQALLDTLSRADGQGRMPVMAGFTNSAQQALAKRRSAD